MPEPLSHVHPWRPAEPDSIECLQIVYKVVERCNINCTYCYYFNMGDHTALERPARASPTVTRQLAGWLAQGCAELKIPRVRISFHGGEPMLLRPSVFDEMCRIFREEIAPVADLAFSVQTNGTILNDQWLETFRRHQVGVGVSIDGMGADHDRHRLDHRGRSTFALTESNIKALVDSAHSDAARLPSTISVLDHSVDYRETYAYLRGLRIQSMSFLLPDRSADDKEFRSSALPAAYGDRLFELFEAWFIEDNPAIQIRFIDEALKHFRVGIPPGPISKRRKNVQILIVRSDGTVVLDDSYIPALKWYSTAPVYAITSSTVREVLSDPVFLRIEELTRDLPRDCRSCRWREMCRGGDLENRYSCETGFDNPSVYCDTYKTFYVKLCELLQCQGYPAEEIDRRFGGDTKAFFS